jgi:hypothetical protein
MFKKLLKQVVVWNDVYNVALLNQTFAWNISIFFSIHQSPILLEP